MSERIQQIRRENSDGTSTIKTTKVIEDDTDDVVATDPARSDATSTAARVVWFIAGMIITLLALRFALVLLGANSANAFAQFIYTLSYPFAAPFFGLFGYDLQYGVSRVELSTLVAMAVYALLAFGIARLLTIRERDRA